MASTMERRMMAPRINTTIRFWMILDRDFKEGGRREETKKRVKRLETATNKILIQLTSDQRCQSVDWRCSCRCNFWIKLKLGVTSNRGTFIRLHFYMKIHILDIIPAVCWTLSAPVYSDGLKITFKVYIKQTYKAQIRKYTALLKKKTSAQRYQACN